MTILLLGFMLWLWDKLRRMLWSYLVVSCSVGAIFLLGSQAQAAYIGNYCGDGRLVASEECDDGNYIDGDGCDYNCHLEEGADTGTVSTGTVSTGTVTPTPTTTTTTVAAKPMYNGKVYRSGRVNGGKWGTAIAPYFNALTSLHKNPKYVLAPFFKWNLPVVYQYIATTLTPLSADKQQAKLTIFLTNIKKLNANWLLVQYDIDLVTLVEVIEAILKKLKTPSLTDLTQPDQPAANYGLTPMPKDDLIQTKVLNEPSTDKGSAVLFSIDEKIVYTHIDWHFNGEVYGCSHDQCKNMVHYVPSGKQEVRATISVKGGAIYYDTATLIVP